MWQVPYCLGGVKPKFDLVAEPRILVVFKMFENPLNHVYCLATDHCYTACGPVLISCQLSD